MSDLELRLALQGDLEAWADRSERMFLGGLKDAVIDESRDAQSALRADVENAGLGQGVANAWRLEIFPPGGRLAWEPSAFLFSRAAHIVDAFSRGEPITARDGGFLAVPIPGSPAWELKLRKGGRRVAAIEQRFGPMRLVVTRRGVRMLVASARERGGALVPLRRARHRDTGERYTPVNQARAEVPMFWLVRQVRLEKRLNWQAIARERGPRFASAVETRLRQRFPGGSASGLAGAFAGAELAAAGEFLPNNWD